MTRHLGFASLLPGVFLALLAGCPSTPTQRAGNDQEITRDITWELRKDKRFEDIRVTCINHLVTLKGRVDDKQAVDDAFAIARSLGRGATVLPRLLIKAK